MSVIFPKTPKLKRNRIKCNRCQDIIESKFRNDFRMCTCGSVFVDGGLEYQRLGFYKKDDFTDLSEWETVDEEQ